MSERAPRVERSNAAVARRIWAATAEGDAGALASVLDENVVWRVHGHHPLAGEYRGRERVIALFADFGDRVDDMRLSFADVYAGRDGAVIAYHLWARRATRVLETDYLLRLRIRDGRIHACDVVPIDRHAADAFFSGLH